jgi:hypothetical protein
MKLPTVLSLPAERGQMRAELSTPNGRSFVAEATDVPGSVTGRSTSVTIKYRDGEHMSWQPLPMRRGFGSWLLTSALTYWPPQRVRRLFLDDASALCMEFEDEDVADERPIVRESRWLATYSEKTGTWKIRRVAYIGYPSDLGLE